MMNDQLNSQPVLEFKDVNFEPYSSEKSTVTVNRGELVLIRLDDVAPRNSFCDIAEGLIDPYEGTIMFEGRSWNEMGEFEQDRARGRIGRVFSAAGWMSNMSIYENISLRLAYHTRMSSPEIRGLVDTIAVALGIDAIPDVRPEALSAMQLRHLSWVRALAGHPVLVLLDQPEKGASRAKVDHLFAMLANMARAGTAAIWLTADETVWKKDINSEITRKCRIADGTVKECGDDG